MKLTDEEKEELINFILGKKIKLSKREKEELIEYINSESYPKEKSTQIRFYSAYGKIRNITKLGNMLIEKGLLRK